MQPLPKKTVKVASIQCSSIMGKVSENTKKIELLVREAAAQGAQILVLPETSITGYLSQDLKTNWFATSPSRENDVFNMHFPNKMDPALHAETCPGPSTIFFGELAKELKVYITVPFLEKETKNGQEFYYNTVCLMDKQGNLAAHYRKNNPWPHPEKYWASKGEDLAVFDTEYGRVGLAICFDIHSILSRYAKSDIWALLYPIAWVGNPFYWFRKQLPNNLQKWNVPFSIIGANWSMDIDQNWEGYGLSTIYGPCGEILAENNKCVGDSICYAEIPLEKKNVEFNYTEYDSWKKFQS